MLLRSALEEKDIEDFSELEQEGIIQRCPCSFSPYGLQNVHFLAVHI
jgi:hypothetical protein